MDTAFWSHVSTLLGVVAIDLSLAVDNAVVMGVVASKLSPGLRSRTILLGVSAAALFRVVFAVFALRLLSVIGLTLAGGLLLLWVGWKLWRELRSQRSHSRDRPDASAGEERSPTLDTGSFRQAVWQIIVADVSMSLDNVLAVAGAARHHPWIMVFGLVLSVFFMSIAANILAKVIRRRRWISYVGLAIVLYVAISMIAEGGHQVLQRIL